MHDLTVSDSVLSRPSLQPVSRGNETAVGGARIISLKLFAL